MKSTMKRNGGNTMKKRTSRFGKIFAAVLTLAMALYPAASAFALQPANYNNQANITVSKTIQASVSGVFPNVTSFQFQLEPISYTPGPTGAGYTAYTPATMPMPAGSTARPQILTVGGFTPTATGTTQTRNFTTGNITYTQAGVYTYKLTEVIPTTTVEGVEYDTTVYYVNVYVTNVLNDDGTPYINTTTGLPYVNVSAVTAWETNNTTHLNPGEQDNNGNGPIPNRPGELDDGKIGITLPTDTDGTVRNISYPFVNDYSTANLDISKLVTGDLADPRQAFTFTLGLVRPSGAAETTSYTYQKYNMGADKVIGGTDDTAVTGTGSTGTITHNGTFTLLHGQYIRIIGMPAGERVTTTETGAADYTTTNIVRHGNTENPASAVTNTDKTTGQQTVYAGEGAINQQDFTNRKESVTPTGVMMDVLPYVLLIVAAGVCAVLIFKKRKVKGY